MGGHFHCTISDLSESRTIREWSVNDESNFFFSLFSVFPNVPSAPGMSCIGEDRKYFSLIIFWRYFTTSGDPTIATNTFGQCVQPFTAVPRNKFNEPAPALQQLNWLTRWSCVPLARLDYAATLPTMTTTMAARLLVASERQGSVNDRHQISFRHFSPIPVMWIPPPTLAGPGRAR